MKIHKHRLLSGSYGKIRTMYPRIYLIGYMGSGKSTIGKALAKELNYGFVDLDDRISEKEKKTIAEIFSVEGETYFRNSEQASLLEISSEPRLVVATGGGTPCFSNNMHLMKSTGIPVYLKQNVEILNQRLQVSASHRPLLGKRSETDLIEFIRNHLNRREPWYNQAPVIVPGLPVEDTGYSAKKILELIGKFIQA